MHRPLPEWREPSNERLFDNVVGIAEVLDVHDSLECLAPLVTKASSFNLLVFFWRRGLDLLLAS
jgi:hypothetical protein